MVDPTEAGSTSFKVFFSSIDYTGVNTYFVLPAMWWLNCPVGDDSRRPSSYRRNCRGSLPGAESIRPEAVSTSVVPTSWASRLGPA